MAKHLGGNCQVQILYPFIDHPKNNPNFTGSHKYIIIGVFSVLTIVESVQNVINLLVDMHLLRI